MKNTHTNIENKNCCFQEHYAKYVKINKELKDTISKSEEDGKYAENITRITQKWLEDLYNIKEEMGEETFNICENKYMEENPPKQEYIPFSRSDVKK